MGTRNRLSKKDDLATTIDKLSGQRDAKDRWEYFRQARQANFLLGALYFQSKLEEVMNEPEQTD